jgi:YD repeat-containing protein
LLTLALLPTSVLAQQPITFQYIYDDLNQLSKVIDSTGVVIQYVYDPVGNILQINRSTVQPGVLTIFNITPLEAGAGATFTIQGQGFSTVLSANTVLVNGVAATVLSASATTLVIQLPANATSGAVSVKVGSTTITYGSNLTVLPTPVLTSVSPTAALSGTTVASFHITGLNLTASSFQIGRGVTVTSATVDPSGASATLSLTVAASAFGRFMVVATNSIGSSSTVGVWGVNSLSVPGIASADPDGDGLANDFELLLGTDPLNADTDGDGFSDGVEVASRSNPLDPNSTPLNSRISGDAESLPFGISNVGFTSATRGEVDSQLFGILNTGATTQTPLEVDSQQFSVLNNPAGTSSPNEADSIPFSVCNAMLGPTSCSDYSGLSLVSRVQGTTETPTPGASAETRGTNGVQGPVDGRPFSVLAVAPADQATRIAPKSPKSMVALAFSAPLDPASIIPGNFSLVAGDQALEPEIRYSADFRTVTLSAPLPPDASILVRVSDQVRDLWGRRLPAFQSEFHTGAAPRVSPVPAAPVVVAQRPAMGATAVSPGVSIHLSLGSAADWNRASNALTITQDGEPVEGRIQMTHGGRDVEFVPYSPFRAGAIVRVSLNGADETDGQLTSRYEGLFTTAASFDVAQPLRAMPGGAAPARVNTVMEFEYSRPLDRSTVTPATVTLREDSTSQPVAAGVMLRGDRIVRVMPSALLLPGASYTVEVSGNVQDMAGRSANPIRQSFTAGSEVAAGPPLLLSTTPADAATDVEVNTEVHLLFDQPVNPLTLDSDTVRLTQDDAPVAASISLTKRGGEVIVTSLAPLKDASRVQLTVLGVEDLSGNMLPSSTVRFQVRADSRFAAAPLKNDGQSVHRPVFAPPRVFEFLIGRR